MAVSHEENIVDFSKNKSSDAILQIFYENIHILTTIKKFFYIVELCYNFWNVFDMMQLLACSVARRWWKVSGQGIKWDLVLSQLHELTFPRLFSLLGCSHKQIFALSSK